MCFNLCVLTCQTDCLITHMDICPPQYVRSVYIPLHFAVLLMKVMNKSVIAVVVLRFIE